MFTDPSRKSANLNRDPDWTAEGGTANPILLPLFTTDKVMDQLADHRPRAPHMKRTPTVKSQTAAEEKTAPTEMTCLRRTCLVTANPRAARNQGSYVLLPGTVDGPVHGRATCRNFRGGSDPTLSRSGVGAAKSEVHEPN